MSTLLICKICANIYSFIFNNYLKEKDRRRQIISTYYRGRADYQNGKLSECLRRFHAARDLAIQQNEYFWAGLASRGISDVYNDTFNAKEEYKYAADEFKYTQKSGRQPYVNYAMLDYARACASMSYKDSVEKYCAQLSDSALKYQDSYLYIDSQRLLGLMTLKYRDYKKSISIYKGICSTPFATERDSLYAAWAFAEDKEIEKSRTYIPRKSKELEGLKSHVLYIINKNVGNLGEALRELEKEDYMSNKSFRERIGQDLNTPVIDYYKEKEKDIEKQFQLESQKKWGMLIIIILIIGISLIVVYVLKSRHSREIDEKVTFAIGLQEMLESSKQESQKNANIVKNLLKSKNKVIEDLCEVVSTYENSKLKKEKIADCVSKLINGLSIDSDEIEQMEKEADKLYDNIFTEFKNTFKKLKPEDYRLYLLTIHGLSNTAIRLLLKEEKVSTIYDRKRRLKDKIKQLDEPQRSKFLRIFI